MPRLHAYFMTINIGSGTPSGIDWRYTALKVRVGPFDAVIVFPPLIFFAMNIAWWTFFLAVAVIVSMWLIEIFLKMPLDIVWKTFRSGMAGNIRFVVPWWKKNRF